MEGKWNARKKGRGIMVNTTSHSKADRGDDEASTQAYVSVRRGV